MVGVTAGYLRAQTEWVSRVPDIFDEVSEDLRADRAQAIAKRYAGLFIAAFVAVLAGTGVYEWVHNQQIAKAEAEAARFIAATPKAANKDGTEQVTLPLTADGIAALRDIAAAGSPGYRTLARFKLADADWQAGRQASAIAGWQAITADTDAPQVMRDLATLVAAQRQLDSADPAALKAQLLPLLSENTRWRPFAEQSLAMLAIRTGKTDEAIKILRNLMKERDVPQGVLRLAADVLQTLGAPPQVDQEQSRG